MEQDIPLLVGIIADDLTSATDGASAFLAKGYAPLIRQDNTGSSAAAIVSTDTNSRALSAAQAATATADGVARLSHARILFKTIDSTLRGHIRQEIAAAFQASGRSRLVVAPAFPEAGRLTLDGIQTVNDTPVSDSLYGRDPVHPATTSRIADLVDLSLGLPVVLACRQANASIPDATVLILDADSQDALNEQVASIPDHQTVLWVGSPGLAIALAALVGAVPDERSARDRQADRVLIVAGSANSVTHAQCETLRAHRIPVVQHLADAAPEGHVVCLQAPLQRHAHPETVVEDLATQASEAIARRDYDAVIATGGETMAAILHRLDITSFFLSRELEPGFPVGRVERADGTVLTIAMKAGGFGSPSTLHDAARELLANPLSRRL